jgi:hypothetical protein
MLAQGAGSISRLSLIRRFYEDDVKVFNSITISESLISLIRAQAPMKLMLRGSI